MRDFTKVSPKIWTSKRFRSLPNDASMFLHIYYLTSRHQTMIGVFEMPDAYARDDLNGWSLKKYHHARAALVDAGLILFDETTFEVLIDGWFAHNPPLTPKHLLGAQRVVHTVKSPDLRDAAMQGLNAAWEAVQLAREVGMAPKLLRRGEGERAWGS